MPKIKSLRLWAFLGVVALVYLPSITLGFVYDDLLLISQNEVAQSSRNLINAWSKHFWQDFEHTHPNLLIYYRPVVTFSLTANWLLAGGDAWVFHLTNVLGHTVAVYLALRVSLGWFKHRWVGWLATAVFAFHPSRWESVNWVSGRTDILMAIGLLGSILCLRSSIGEKSRNRFLWYAGGIILFVIACMSKETAVMMPFLLVIEWVSWRGKENSKTGHEAALNSVGDYALRKRGTGYSDFGVLALGGIAFLSCAYFCLRMFVFPIKSNAGEVVPKYFFTTVLAYTERVVFPWPQSFFIRPVQLYNGEVVADNGVLIAGGIIAFLYIALIIYAFRRAKLACALLVSAIAFLGPLLNVTYTGVPSTASDRFLYLPIFLLSGGMLSLVEGKVGHLRRLCISKAILGFTGLIYIGAMWSSLGFMRNEKALWEHEYSINPQLPNVARNTARYLARVGQLEEAHTRFARSLSKESLSYAQLSTSEMRAAAFVELRQLDAALLPDGATAGLRQVYYELESWVSGYPENGGVLGLSREAYSLMLKSNSAKMYGEIALLASRLGEDSKVGVYLSQISNADEQKVSNAMNLALAAARAGNEQEVERWLEVELSLQERGISLNSSSDYAGLKRRIDDAKSMREQAKNAPPVPKALLLAQADAELGAYGNGLRRLAPIYEANPEELPVAQLYAQLLVAARLEGRAEEVITKALGPEQAKQVVAEIREQLPERLRKTPAVDIIAKNN